MFTRFFKTAIILGVFSMGILNAQTQEQPENVQNESYEFSMFHFRNAIDLIKQINSNILTKGVSIEWKRENSNSLSTHLDSLYYLSMHTTLYKNMINENIITRNKQIDSVVYAMGLYSLNINPATYSKKTTYVEIKDSFNFLYHIKNDILNYEKSKKRTPIYEKDDFLINTPYIIISTKKESIVLSQCFLTSHFSSK